MHHEQSPNHPILSVHELSELIKETLEDNFVQVWVRGEISNLSRPASGHWYLTLKDSSSQLRCVMFRSANRVVPFQPEHGQQVTCRGRVSLYSQRGDVQFICDSMEAEGYGSLQLAFEQLKKQLEAEGLFSLQHKQTLPAHPQCIGVVTSATGAAIHDIMNVLQRRAAGIRIILRPVLVQGEQASELIATAIKELNQHGQAQVLIVGRGGGSLEDLQAFNSELVARAIFTSSLPVISAVGHETDFTIADFVADLRTPTPSAAAELVVKNRLELEQHVDQLSLRLNTSIRHHLQHCRQQLESLHRRLRSPRHRLRLQQQHYHELSRRLQQAIIRHHQRCQHQLTQLTGRLDALSLLDTLKRGFTMVTTADDRQTLIRRSADLHQGQQVRLMFYDGQAVATVDQIDHDNKNRDRS
ncbi:MAG: exodeoxyribonuclease VII large subunit [Desulfuromonas sp.]|nr:exodeoxyribonuclease VII large subunit [Desulfuromonas sp.]